MKPLTLEFQRKGLLASISDTFTQPSVFIKELLQNARRAGADSITIHTSGNELTVIDNGKGFDEQSLTALFTLGLSNWDKETTEAEYPYGLGFLSAILVAESVHIRSNGLEVKFNTEDLMAGQPVEITETETPENTFITLQLKKKLLSENFLRDILLYFPITVNVTGDINFMKVAPSFSGYTKRETGYGTLYVRTGLTLPRHYNITESLRPKIIVQGFLTPLKGLYHSNDVILLANNKIKARMPERDTLIDSDEVREVVAYKIPAIAKEMIVEELTQLKGALTDDEFIANKNRLNTCFRVAKELLEGLDIPFHGHHLPDLSDVVGYVRDQDEYNVEDIDIGLHEEFETDPEHLILIDTMDEEELRKLQALSLLDTNYAFPFMFANPDSPLDYVYRYSVNNHKLIYLSDLEIDVVSAQDETYCRELCVYRKPYTVQITHNHQKWELETDIQLRINDYEHVCWPVDTQHPRLDFEACWDEESLLYAEDRSENDDYSSTYNARLSKDLCDTLETAFNAYKQHHGILELGPLFEAALREVHGEIAKFWDPEKGTSINLTLTKDTWAYQVEVN